MAEAGKYVLLDLFWDERTNPVTEQVAIFKRHLKGEVLELDEAEATRLVDAGSVEKEGERQAIELSVARERFLAALANTPDEVKATVLGGKTVDEAAAEYEDREVPLEELHVHHPAAQGFTNAGHPKYAAAAQGEGGVGEGLDEAGDETATTEELDATQASLDDGTKTSANARGGAGVRRDVNAQAQRTDVKAGAKSPKAE